MTTIEVSRHQRCITLTAMTIAALVGLSCSSPTPPAPPKAPAAPATSAPPAAPAPAAPAPPAATDSGAPISAEATNVFNTRCSICHGTTGHGDGPGAVALNPKPRSFGDPTWQAGVTDEHIAKVTVEGGPAVGLSALMVPNPDLASKPEIVKDLVRLVRVFKQP